MYSIHHARHNSLQNLSEIPLSTRLGKAMAGHAAAQPRCHNTHHSRPATHLREHFSSGNRIDLCPTITTTRCAATEPKIYNRVGCLTAQRISAYCHDFGAWLGVPFTQHSRPYLSRLSSTRHKFTHAPVCTHASTCTSAHAHTQAHMASVGVCPCGAYAHQQMHTNLHAYSAQTDAHTSPCMHTQLYC